MSKELFTRARELEIASLPQEEIAAIYNEAAEKYGELLYKLNDSPPQTTNDTGE